MLGDSIPHYKLLPIVVFQINQKWQILKCTQDCKTAHKWRCEVVFGLCWTRDILMYDLLNASLYSYFGYLSYHSPQNVCANDL